MIEKLAVARHQIGDDLYRLAVGVKFRAHSGVENLAHGVAR